MDFMKMRQQLGSPDTMNKKKQEEVKEQRQLSGVSLATIIEKKPSSKVVLKYFKKKYGEVSSSDED
jgi:hypothetical protein